MDTHDHAMRTYSQRLQSNVKTFAWSGGCNNWYRTASGKVTNNWPGYAFKYRLMMRLNDSSNYRFVRALAGNARNGPQTPGVNCSAAARGHRSPGYSKRTHVVRVASRPPGLYQRPS